MIENFECAKRVNDLLREVSGILDESVGVLVEGECLGDERSRYAEIIGQLLGVIGLDLLNPIYQIHPQLMPEQYRSDGSDE